MKTQCGVQVAARRTIGLLLVCHCFADALSVGHGSLKIDPELDPKSDKKFFGPPFPADYPSDTRPGGKPDFNYPFPHVQHSAKYDEDYIKDENTDNGEWKAQNDYDLAKARLARERQEMEAARLKEEQEKGEIDGAKDNLAKAMTRAEKIKHLQGIVNDKMANLDNCQQQLEDARKALKDFVAQIEGGYDGLDFENKTAEAMQEKAAADESLQKEEGDLPAVKAAVEDEARDVEAAKAELEKAESRLRAMRNAGKYTPAPAPPPPPAPVQSAAHQARGVAVGSLAALLVAALFA